MNIDKNYIIIFFLLLENALLYKIVGENEVLTGFAETHCDGSYTLYDVPAGTYKIAAIHPDYPDDTAWSGQFTISANKTVPDIFLGAKNTA